MSLDREAVSMGSFWRMPMPPSASDSRDDLKTVDNMYDPDLMSWDDGVDRSITWWERRRKRRAVKVAP